MSYNAYGVLEECSGRGKCLSMSTAAAISDSSYLLHKDESYSGGYHLSILIIL